ncbi:glutamine amidotransferase [Yaniella flava]|uniref:glutamine--fructose-6-phosphate transaminase (isomerizing) n=1 Tax=Yaniella flava TaxID=287930 RepID=A0ABP5FJE6_9MICC|nr:glutamine amidotransferase [Micrococcaceae bacterium]
MCGIAGIHLRDESLYPQLGSLLHEMVEGIVVRGPDSAGVALYGDRERLPENYSSVSMLSAPEDIVERVRAKLPDADVSGEEMAETSYIRAKVASKELVKVIREVAPEARQIGTGDDMVVYKGVGHPMDLAEEFRLGETTGWQGVIHTRLATESAVDAEGAHPYSVGTGLSLVHNGSFSNHSTIRRELQDAGVEFNSQNDTEVAAQYISYRMEEKGEDLDTAIRALSETFDGFYTLLVTTQDGFAVARDEFACKPAIVAEHPNWVAMASEFQAMAHLPGIEDAEIFEPEPGKVYTWNR